MLHIFETLLAIFGGGFLVLWGNAFLFAAEPENRRLTLTYHVMAYVMFTVALAGVWLSK